MTHIEEAKNVIRQKKKKTADGWEEEKPLLSVLLQVVPTNS